MHKACGVRVHAPGLMRGRSGWITCAGFGSCRVKHEEIRHLGQAPALPSCHNSSCHACIAGLQYPSRTTLLTLLALCGWQFISHVSTSACRENQQQATKHVVACGSTRHCKDMTWFNNHMHTALMVPSPCLTSTDGSILPPPLANKHRRPPALSPQRQSHCPLRPPPTFQAASLSSPPSSTRLPLPQQLLHVWHCLLSLELEVHNVLQHCVFMQLRGVNSHHQTATGSIEGTEVARIPLRRRPVVYCSKPAVWQCRSCSAGWNKVSNSTTHSVKRARYMLHAPGAAPTSTAALSRPPRCDLSPETSSASSSLFTACRGVVCVQDMKNVATSGIKDCGLLFPFETCNVTMPACTSYHSVCSLHLFPRFTPRCNVGAYMHL